MKIVEIYGISEEQGVISCPVEDLLFRLTRGHGDGGTRGHGGHGHAGTR
ncbi:MAG: hypothetical protein RMY29_012785 [Nostoc sp. CreGUA01]|nr:hypothetical protein [Nostoc sp. CreGUA01]